MDHALVDVLAELAARLPRWHLDAACRDADPDLFFLDRGSGVTASAAKAICQGCPVRVECLEWAIELSLDVGIFGGMAGKRRAAYARSRRREAASPDN